MKNENEQNRNLCNHSPCALPLCCYSHTNIQNAVANMIDAQGEQIKKIVSLAEDTSCITTINELVNKNIYQLTIFENSISDHLKYCCLHPSPLDPVCGCDIDGGTF